MLSGSGYEMTLTDDGSEYWEFANGKGYTCGIVSIGVLNGHSEIERLTMCDAKRKAKVEIYLT